MPVHTALTQEQVLTFLDQQFKYWPNPSLQPPCDETRLTPGHCGIMMQAHINVDSEHATWRDNSNLVMINNQCLYTIQHCTFIRKINQILF